MALKVDDLYKRAGSRVMLDHVNFEMKKPGIFAIIGEGDSGKTELMRELLGLSEPDEGEISFDGSVILSGSLTVGYLPEERGLYRKAGVLEQLVYFAMLRGMPRQAARRSAKALLERMNMGHLGKVSMETLDKDERDKVLFLSALVHEPKLILLDEPFRTANPDVIEEMTDLLKELAKEDRYIVIATREIEVAEECCDNLLLLHNGKPLLSGNLREIKRAYGHTNLVLAADVDVTATAIDFGMELIEKREDETEYRIQGDDMAATLLEHMLSQGFRPTKYEIREPSLQEIYHAKIGGQMK